MEESITFNVVNSVVDNCSLNAEKSSSMYVFL